MIAIPPPPPLPGSRDAKAQLDRIETAVTDLAGKVAAHETALQAVTVYVDEQKSKLKTARGIATVGGSMAAAFVFDALANIEWSEVAHHALRSLLGG